MKENKAGLAGTGIREGLEFLARGGGFSGALCLGGTLRLWVRALGSFQRLLVLDPSCVRQVDPFLFLPREVLGNCVHP